MTNGATNKPEASQSGSPFGIASTEGLGLRSMLREAAAVLDDYADLYQHCIILNDGTEFDRESKQQRERMLVLRDKLHKLAGEHESKAAIPTPLIAGAVIAQMLEAWELPGAVWYHTKNKRFRLVGDGYKPSRQEVCAGVYLPGATAEMLADDFGALLKSPNASLSGGRQ